MYWLSGANDLSGQGHGLMSVFSSSVNGLRFILSSGLCSRFHLYKKSLKPFYFRHKLSHFVLYIYVCLGHNVATKQYTRTVRVVQIGSSCFITVLAAYKGGRKKGNL